MSHQASLQSVQACQQLGLTGRVFANDISAFAMTEGPTELVKQYFQAIEAGPMVETIILHVDRPIAKREFDDYLILLNSKESLDFGPHIGVLTAKTLRSALPPNPSVRLRIMVEAFQQDVLAA